MGGPPLEEEPELLEELPDELLEDEEAWEPLPEPLLATPLPEPLPAPLPEPLLDLPVPELAPEPLPAPAPLPPPVLVLVVVEPDPLPAPPELELGMDAKPELVPPPPEFDPEGLPPPNPGSGDVLGWLQETNPMAAPMNEQANAPLTPWMFRIVFIFPPLCTVAFCCKPRQCGAMVGYRHWWWIISWILCFIRELQKSARMQRMTRSIPAIPQQGCAAAETVIYLR
jgi:hypothetical protein